MHVKSVSKNGEPFLPNWNTLKATIAPQMTGESFTLSHKLFTSLNTFFSRITPPPPSLKYPLFGAYLHAQPLTAKSIQFGASPSMYLKLLACYIHLSPRLLGKAFGRKCDQNVPIRSISTHRILQLNQWDDDNEHRHIYTNTLQISFWWWKQAQPWISITLCIRTFCTCSAVTHSSLSLRQLPTEQQDSWPCAVPTIASFTLQCATVPLHTLYGICLA